MNRRRSTPRAHTRRRLTALAICVLAGTGLWTTTEFTPAASPASSTASR